MGTPSLRVLGGNRPYPGHPAQGLQGGDGGVGEEHLRRAHLQPDVPQGT
jgi:hypothetical protein